MTLKDFFRKYPDEASCKLAFKQMRDKQGVSCKKCGCTDHYWKSDKWQYECKDCGFRTTLRSDTVMQGSNLPYQYWLTAIAFLTTTKKSFSALEMQRQLGHKRYEPIWAMMHKLRLVMGNRDARYKLSDYIEMDEGFFESVNSRKKVTDQLNVEVNENKRGRGSEKQSKVLVAVESMAVNKNTKPVKYKHKPDKKCGYLKMIVMDDLTAEGINFEVKSNINKQAIILTDGYRGYSKLKNYVKKHQAHVCKDKNEMQKVFPWVHTTISNAKKICQGIHHSIKDVYMQNYLDEFCYKFNRRYFGDKIFDRLLIDSVTDTWKDFRYDSG